MKADIFSFSSPYPDWHNQPLHLTQVEIRNPITVLAAFFDCYHLPEARVCLKRWLENSMESNSTSASSLLFIHDSILRLVEAAWLIHRQQPLLSHITSPDGNTDLEAALTLIVAAVAPERIYLLSSDPVDLMIVMPDLIQRSFKDYETVVEMAGLNQKEMYFSLHRSTELSRHLQEGHIFYASACIPEKLVYDNGISPLSAIPPISSNLKTEALRRFEPGFKRAASFLKAAKHHHSYQEREMAAFMLHQATELAFRAIILAVLGQDLRTHEIGELKRSCRRLIPEVSQIFDPEHEQSGDLIAVLNRAYKAARYAPKYDISDETLRVLFDRVELLHEHMISYINNLP